MLDFGDRPPRLHAFDRGRPPSTARKKRPLRAVNGGSENATLSSDARLLSYIQAYTADIFHT